MRLAEWEIGVAFQLAMLMASIIYTSCKHVYSCLVPAHSHCEGVSEAHARQMNGGLVIRSCSPSSCCISDRQLAGSGGWSWEPISSNTA